MGNLTMTKQKSINRSFDELTNGINSLNLSNEKSMRHRYSEAKLSDRALRNQYFNKLNNNKKGVEDKPLTIFAEDQINRIGTKGEFRHKMTMSNEMNYPFDDNHSYFNNHSWIEKKIHLDMSDDLFYQDQRRSVKKANILIRDNSKKSSSIGKNIKNNSSNNNNTHRNSTRNRIKKSLSHIENELSSYSITKNTLFLNNELDHDFNNLESFIEQNSSVNSNSIINRGIDIKKKNHKRKNTISSENKKVSIPFDRDDLTTAGLNRIVNNNNNKDISLLSNVYYQQSKIINNDYELNYVKNGEDIRRSYIAKLIYKKVWQPLIKEKDHNTLIIFDWDDTLLCTSFLTPNGIFNEDLELSDKDKEKIVKLEFSVLRLLTEAISKGDCYIITNAAPGWVEYSSERFYPSVRQILNKVKIISARGEYESIYPGDSRMWKIQSFLNMQKNFDNNLVTNIICLGDSFIEMEAAHVLASKFSQAFIKTIKFRESPKPEELNKQLSLIADQFPVIYSTVKNLTIRVEKKTKR